MNYDKSELYINGESIQSLYASYLKGNFQVNRRYQRKLVWSINEKQSFINSISNGYPVPLILLAEANTNNRKKKEIIDGMQRMNAIISFIEQEFSVDGGYFDLNTIADTKLAMDDKVLVQKEPVLSRDVCASIVRYEIPLSVYQESTQEHVDEVFRRLNSGGKHLSKQELRQAGSTSKFASIVRKVAANIRGDSSQSDILSLDAMKTISITNKNLDYGINIDNIFWVKQNIITKEFLRDSKDEEIIADIVCWITLPETNRSSSVILDQLYEISDHETSLSKQVELQIQKVNSENIINNIQYVFDELIRIIELSGKTFNTLFFKSKQARISRYFQIVFISFYNLIVNENLTISKSKEKKLIALLDGAGDRIINLSGGGGNWSAKEKKIQVDSFTGVIRNNFIKNRNNDPSRNEWITRFENLLMQSSVEQVLYDFKMGLYPLYDHDNTISNNSLPKIVKTLTAMVNSLPESTGYCILGVADSKNDSDRYESFFNDKVEKYSKFFITGVDKEAEKNHKTLDLYLKKINQLIAKEPISERDKDFICRNINTISYLNKTVIILKLEVGQQPSIYDNKYYVRYGSHVTEVEPKDFGELYSRFVV
ncbi:DUF262 domain-containing protein [Photobacterium sp. GB-210]|uniref:GmrSD restriction endonuclease domain-containing protein n=1 Tax=Photobacterium sp. GB-210 TaxID=2022104 RepID=UPI000D162E05|nr:DUF262 domain-containing protein [Photobacterium sp. GB-210]PSV37290.1 hypothetical protein C9J38_11010 [Photobacterium sp. GB-210]